MASFKQQLAASCCVLMGCMFASCDKEKTYDKNEIPLDGIVARYLCDNMEGLDESSNGLNLSNSGVTLTEDRFGNDNKAYLFNGSSSFSLLNQELNNQSESQTISLWLKTSSLNSEGFGGLIFGITTIGLTGGTGSRFNVSMKNGIIKCAYGDGYNAEDNTWNELISSQSTFNDSQWHHVVFASKGDDSTAFLTIDGEIAAFTTWSRSNNNRITPLNVFMGGKENNYFTGCIDDVIFYGRALTLEEIMSLYKY